MDKLQKSLLTACLSLLLVMTTLSACSQRESPQSPAIPSTSSAAADRATPVLGFDVESLEKLSGKVAAGGIATRYTAYFDAGQLKGIVEQRQADGKVHRGEYVFLGARLTQYSGVALTGDAVVQLGFDMQGRAEATNSRLSDNDIAAIRNRAQLLRSHALAQLATRTH